MKGEDNQDNPLEGQNPWGELIPDEQWSVYQQVIQQAKKQGIQFSMGGAFAVATYTGHWRNTKDLDFFVLPQDREAMIQVVTEVGLHDYFDELPYERHWIYRAIKDGIIVDIIWAMANRRAEVDQAWFTRGPEIEVRGELLRIVPPEEMVWAKIYIVQKERCDWTDIFNILYFTGQTLDWNHLLERLGQDIPLLRGVLSVFSWLSPGQTRTFPHWIWERLQVPEPEIPTDPYLAMKQRTDLMDTRPWFAPLIPEDQSQ